MKSGILGGLVAHAALSLLVEDEITRGNFYPRADTISIRSCPNQQNLQPVIRIAAIVAEQLRPLAVVIDKNV